VTLTGYLRDQASGSSLAAMASTASQHPDRPQVWLRHH
jgi:hypothetical protein